MLDVNTFALDGGVPQNTFTWLEDVLAAAQRDGAKVIAVSHQNLYAHSSLLHEGYVIRNASMLHSKYSRHGVSVNLSGHLHIQHTLQGEGGVPEIVTSALSVSPCQYGVIETDSTQASYHTQAVDVAAWAKRNGKTDINLLGFRQYAAAFFAVTAVNQAVSQLANDPDASGMATWLAALNAAYFSGRLDTVSADSPYASRWMQSDAFFSAYVSSILSEPLMDHTRFTFPL